MQKIRFVVLSVFWIVITGYAKANDVVKKPVSHNLTLSEIIDRYIEASGGDLLLGIQNEVRKGTLLRGRTGKVPLEVIADASGKWVYNQTFAWGDQISYGYDGSNGWVQDTEKIGEMNPRQLLDLKLMLDFQSPLKIRELYPEMSIKGMERIGEREAVIVVATSSSKLTTELAFDAETGLLLRAGDILFEDYRKVGNVQRPFCFVLGENKDAHLKMKMEFSDIQHDSEIKDMVFEKPCCVHTMKTPPLYKSRKPVEVDIEALEACVGVYRDVDNPEFMFIVTRQQNHLMVEWVGKSGRSGKVEIRPESETDYFIQFLGWDFHFKKDISGDVIRLAVDANRPISADKVE